MAIEYRIEHVTAHGVRIIYFSNDHEEAKAKLIEYRQRDADGKYRLMLRLMGTDYRTQDEKKT